MKYRYLSAGRTQRIVQLFFCDGKKKKNETWENDRQKIKEKRSKGTASHVEKLGFVNRIQRPEKIG